VSKPCCPCCGTPIDLTAFRFTNAPQNPGERRGPAEVLNRDPRLERKSLLGEEAGRAIGYPTSYAGTFDQFVHSALMAPLFGLTNDPATPANVRAIFDIAANLVLYSWFVREFAAVGILMGYVALEAALRGADQKRKTLGALMKDHVGHEALTNAIMRESVVRIFEDERGNLREYSDWLIQNRLKEWQRQVSEAARLRNALAHGDKEILSEATCDEAGTRLQFIGEMINRVCADDLLKKGTIKRDTMDTQHKIDILTNQLDWVQRYVTDLITLSPRPTPKLSEVLDKKLSVARPFFVMVQSLLFDHAILELCKMVDDKQKGTLTMTRLLGQVTDGAEKERLMERTKALPMERLRKARNKLISHSDISILGKYPNNVRDEGLDISVEDLSKIVSSVVDILKGLANLIGVEFRSAYHSGAGKWADALLTFIGKAETHVQEGGY